MTFGTVSGFARRPQGGRARGPAAPRVEPLVEPGAHQEAEVLPAHRSQRITDEPVAGVTPLVVALGVTAKLLDHLTRACPAAVRDAESGRAREVRRRHARPGDRVVASVL